jgi:hypothetical protein
MKLKKPRKYRNYLGTNIVNYVNIIYMETILTKREVIEMVYRPQPVPAQIFEQLFDFWMKSTGDELAREFTKSTKLKMEYSGSGLFTIKY